ncbi:MAG: hypothetical protein QM703_22195 [Gemmatales bacterium]
MIAPCLPYFVIAFLWYHSDRAYNPEDESVPIIFQHHKAKLLIYVPPGRQRLVAMDLKTMSFIGSYQVTKNVEFPKTPGGKAAQVMRFVIPHPDTLKGVPIINAKPFNVNQSVIIVFNTREAGVFDLRSEFYQLISTSGDW